MFQEELDKLPSLMTYRTANGRRVVVHTKHNLEEYMELYRAEYENGDVADYDPLKVLDGYNDDERHPGVTKNYWLILENKRVVWYEVPDED